MTGFFLLSDFMILLFFSLQGSDFSQTFLLESSQPLFIRLSMNVSTSFRNFKACSFQCVWMASEMHPLLGGFIEHFRFRGELMLAQCPI